MAETLISFVEGFWAMTQIKGTLPENTTNQSFIRTIIDSGRPNPMLCRIEKMILLTTDDEILQWNILVMCKSNVELPFLAESKRKP